MSEQSATQSKTQDIYQQLDANERAIIDGIQNPLLRSLLLQFIAIKVQLQFTGWLQFVIPIVPTTLVLLMAGLLALVGLEMLAGVFAALGVLLVIVMAFDVVTVKWGIRPTERHQHHHGELDVFSLMRQRHSCRSFQLRDLTDPDRDALLASLDRHATADGNYPRFEYIKAPLTVWPTLNAREFIVAIAGKQYDRKEVIEVGRRLQKVVIDATRMGLGTCWIGPGADHDSLREHLGDRFDPAHEHFICVCAVGYESRFSPLFIRFFSRKMHSRLPLDALFFSDSQLTRPIDPEDPALQVFGRTFEACQWSPSSYNGQTIRCVAVTNETGQPQRFDFLVTTASQYYVAVACGIWFANWELGCEALGIKGHFETLAVNDQTTYPKYERSWVIDSLPA